MTDDQEHRRSPLDEPTVMGPASGDLGQSPVQRSEEPRGRDHSSSQPDEPTVPGDAVTTGHFDEAKPASSDEEPTLAEPTVAGTEATVARPMPGGAPAEPIDTGGWPQQDEQTPTSQTSPQPDEPTLADPATPDTEATTAGPMTGHNPPTNTSNPTASEPTTGDWPSNRNEATGGDKPTLAAPTTPDADATIAGPVVGANSPTVFEPVIGGWWSDRDEQTDEPTLAHDGLGENEATVAQPGASGDEPTLAEPGLLDDEVTVRGDDEPTLAVGADEATTTGPTVGSWPFDQFEAPPSDELIWRVDAPPAAAPSAARRPAYYVALGAAVVLVVGLVALAAFVSVARPRQEVAGDAVGRGGVPEITTSSAAAPPPTTSTTGAGPFAELAAQPLSSATARMPDATCSLPRFDPADDRQADFYTAAKACADAAWRPVLSEAGLEGDVTVVTLTGPAQTQTCGELAPTSPPTQCDGVVYLTPAYLRDTEQNGRYPGRYLGVFLREYARAIQFTNGIDELVGASTAAPGADLDTRVEQQATCLAGVMAGAMSGRGAIDSNITKEIRDRLSAVDAPADARDWLDKGFQQRTPAACNSWTG